MEIYGGTGPELPFPWYISMFDLLQLDMHNFCALKGKADKLLFLKINRCVNNVWKMDINNANVKLSQNYQM